MHMMPIKISATFHARSKLLKQPAKMIAKHATLNQKSSILRSPKMNFKLDSA